jgi:hypothetical protein
MDAIENYLSNFNITISSDIKSKLKSKRHICLKKYRKTII